MKGRRLHSFILRYSESTRSTVHLSARQAKNSGFVLFNLRYYVPSALVEILNPPSNPLFGKPLAYCPNTQNAATIRLWKIPNLHSRLDERARKKISSYYLFKTSLCVIGKMSVLVRRILRLATSATNHLSPLPFYLVWSECTRYITAVFLTETTGLIISSYSGTTQAVFSSGESLSIVSFSAMSRSIFPTSSRSRPRSARSGVMSSVLGGLYSLKRFSCEFRRFLVKLIKTV